ncbi:response regulator transcription factor [Clostridium sp. D2Q-11]|uniref:Response regulator transcription factor n=1 Tax=Anaeromonas frigoriresistens TaxID=2683708 RepID=A0A942V083_9FIRM|nr:response regulator transcription factor [Anaeromonas frigoriresistens]MBS4538797.1 response regulator transcription factor [Anaeromonas frigoriresistens]
MNILVAEDEGDIRELIVDQLKSEGYTVYPAKNGIEALEIFNSEDINLAILDVMMPKLDGFNLLRKIRSKSYIPVIFLTARGEEMDKVLGLELGADDYLIKPFSIAELKARINSQLRRTTIYNSESKTYKEYIKCGDLTLDKDACCLYKKGQEIILNAKEYLLLSYLMERSGKVFTKKQLYEAVWEEDYFFDNNTVMVHISYIRNKIEDDPKNPQYIQTIRGIGYKFSKSEVIKDEA